MKTIILTLCLVGAVFIKNYHDIHYYRTGYQENKKELDSLRIMLTDVSKDSIVLKMLNDFAYRTKVNTLVNVLPDQEIIKLVNKYAPRHRSRVRDNQNVAIAKTRNY